MMILALVVSDLFLVFLWRMDASGTSQRLERLEQKLDWLHKKVLALQSKEDREPRKGPPPIPASEIRLSALRSAATMAPVAAAVQAPMPSQSSPVTPQADPRPRPLPAPAPLVSHDAGGDWESFTGIKLFAWLGGLAFFLAGAFFVKYSIDRNLISPELRLELGAASGLALIAAAFLFSRARYEVLRQSLAASGIGILYAVIFAACLYYRFLEPGLGFGLLALTSAAAFTLAVAQDAPAIAVLGGAGAWVSMVVLESEGMGLPSMAAYLALVALSLHQVARRLDRAPLAAFATLGTVAALVAAGAMRSVNPGPWTIGIVWCGQFALFMGAVWNMPWDPRSDAALGVAALVSFLSVLFAAASQLWVPGPCAAIMMLAGTALALLVGRRHKNWAAAAIYWMFLAGAVLLLWVCIQPGSALSNLGLGILFSFGIVGGLGPAVMLRDRETAAALRPWALAFPLCLAAPGLALVFLHPDLPAAFWPLEWLLNGLGLLLALAVGSVSMAFVLVFLLLVSGAAWVILGRPLDADFGILLYPGMAAFALALSGALLWVRSNLSGLRRTLALDSEEPSDSAQDPVLMEWIAATPVLGVFVLLALSLSQGLPQGPHLGMAVSTCLFLFGIAMAKRGRDPGLAAVCTLASLLPVLAWAAFPAEGAGTAALAWSLGLWILFHAVALLLWNPEDDWKEAWCALALAQSILALLAVHAARLQWGEPLDALPPFAMALIQCLVVIRMVRRLKEKACRDLLLAVHGSALLLLVSCLPAMLLDQGWMDMVFVVEGVALVWLHSRVPHRLLPAAALSFIVWGGVGMILNLDAMRGLQAQPFLNPGYGAWVCAAILMVDAAALAKWNKTYPVWAADALICLAFGTCFYLLNLSIAEFFVPVGAAISLASNGNLGQELAQSLGWLFFALGMLGLGLGWHRRALRVTGLLGVGVTAFKIFFNDLWSLGQLYRVGSFVGLACALLLVSFLYQRFVAESGTKT